MLKEHKLHRARGPVSLFSDYKFRHTVFFLGIFSVYVLAVNEKHNVCVLFYRAAFPEIRELRAAVGSGFCLTA